MTCNVKCRRRADSTFQTTELNAEGSNFKLKCFDTDRKTYSWFRHDGIPVFQYLHVCINECENNRWLKIPPSVILPFGTGRRYLLKKSRCFVKFHTKFWMWNVERANAEFDSFQLRIVVAIRTIWIHFIKPQPDSIHLFLQRSIINFHFNYRNAFHSRI